MSTTMDQALALVYPNKASTVLKASGVYSDPTGWTAGVPQAGQTWYTPPGLTLTLDTPTAKLGRGRLDGNFTALDKTRLWADTVVTGMTCNFQAGTKAAPLSSFQFLAADNGPIDLAS